LLGSLDDEWVGCVEVLRDLIEEGGVRLWLLMREWFQTGWLNPETLVAAVVASGCVQPGKVGILQRGFRAYASADSITAIHVLVPQLEDTLRFNYGRLGRPTTTVRQGQQQAVPLDAVLESREMQSWLGPGVAAGLRALLVERAGMNLRNDVAHGLVTDDECSAQAASAVVWTFLRLATQRA